VAEEIPEARRFMEESLIGHGLNTLIGVET